MRLQDYQNDRLESLSGCLLTWNCKHLANAVIQSRLQPVAGQRGYRLPVVCTPLQLMGTIEYEG